MARYVVAGAVTGASVNTSGIALRSFMLSSSSGTASATLKGNGVNEIVLQCAANQTVTYPAVSGGNQFSLEQIPGPVTIDVVGAGAFVRISY